MHANANTDPEVQRLFSCIQELEREYPYKHGNWTESPIEWFKPARVSTRRAGTIGEKVVSQYLTFKGFSIEKSPDSDADRVIDGIRAEIKTSRLWEDGNYKFQQLRDQNYAFAICLGISPFDAHCWVLPKDAIMQLWQKGNLTTQHGGEEGHDTAWFTVTPGQEPDWLKPYGGRLEQAVALIKQLTGHR